MTLPLSRGAALLVLLEPGPPGPQAALELLRADGLTLLSHVLGPEALASDRAALAELDEVLATCAREPGVDPERLGVLGFGRAGTLAFLLGCARRVAAVIDLDGPVLHPALDRQRPTQPLELALNLEGAFLGVFGAEGPVGAEERAALRARLVAAARPFELVVLPGREIVVDPRRPGYDEARATELWRRVRAFLRVALASGDDEP